MKIAIHQPNYLPWPGYFKKMSMCDVFVFLDDVELNKEGYTRRVRIRHPQQSGESTWLTVPLKKYRMHDRISELFIDQDKSWAEQHLGMIRQAYRHTTGWPKTANWIRMALEKCNSYRYLADMNIFLIQEIASFCGIDCAYVRASELAVSGKADVYTYRIVKELGGTQYIRGMGEQRYARSGTWQSDKTLEINQVDYKNEMENDPTGTWKHGYSMVDLIMRKGDVSGYFG